MKKTFSSLLSVLIIVIFSLFFANEVFSAEYVVMKGDNLSKIAKKIHQPVRELLMINEKIDNPNKLYPGQKIKFLSGLDILHALMLATSRMEKMQNYEKDYAFFYELRNMIEKGQIGGKKGIHPGLIIELAEEYRNK